MTKKDMACVIVAERYFVTELDPEEAGWKSLINSEAKAPKVDVERRYEKALKIRALRGLDRLVAARRELIAAGEEFESLIKTRVCGQDYYQLAGMDYKKIREIATLIQAEITGEIHDEEYTHHSFEYRGMTFIWLEERNAQN